MRKIIAVALMLLFLVGGVSEAVNLKNGIIGDWIEVHENGGYGQQIIKFLKNGKVNKIEENSKYNGSYKFIDDNHLEINLRPIGARVFDVSINQQGQLILTTLSGNVTRYISLIEVEKRIKESFVVSDLTVLHKDTKLMWARNGSDETMNWKDAFKFIENLNEQKYAGYSDWRLPSLEEFKTLIDFANSQPFTAVEIFNNIVGFKNLLIKDRKRGERGGLYWSYESVSGNKRQMAYYFFRGDAYEYSMTDSVNVYVLPVRTEQ